MSSCAFNQWKGWFLSLYLLFLPGLDFIRLEVKSRHHAETSHRTRWTVTPASRGRLEAYFLLCGISPRRRGQTQPARWGKDGKQHSQCCHVLFNPRVPVFRRRLVCLYRCVCLFVCVYLVFKVFLLGYFSISRVQLSSQLVAVWSAFSSVCLCNIKERKCSVLRVLMLLLLPRLHSAEDKREFCQGLFRGEGLQWTVRLGTW